MFSAHNPRFRKGLLVPKADRKPIYTTLYFQVVTGIILGVVLGFVWPETGAAMRPLGDGFIKLIRMIIAPIIFGTVVVGIAKMGDMKDVGRIGIKALVYFEVVSTLALVVGLVVVNLLQPGVGINADPAALDATAVKAYANTAETMTTTQFILNIIPTTVVDAFARGEILQVLLFSILFGLALLHLGEKGKAFIGVLDDFTHAMFGVVGMIMRVAPIGAFGAMAFTIGQFGIGTLFSLGKLMAGVYITCLLFVFLILGSIARWSGFSLWKFLKYIKEELLIVLGTSSSESVLPRMMAKLENLGCARPVVGLVIPTGYSFNLDGTSVYMTMAAVFIAQATNTPLTIGQQLGILGVLLLTSKGAAAVTGGGFITLAATLSAIPTLPVAGLALLIGVDRFMSEARALTNLVGNGVATVAVARWDGALDTRRMKRVLDGETVREADEPEEVLVAHETVAARR
jgi:aerobic C4-dicarboxylate transport protein